MCSGKYPSELQEAKFTREEFLTQTIAFKGFPFKLCKTKSFRGNEK